MQETVILVDNNGRQIGTEETLTAHSKCLLHRAISIFIFNTKDELLIQRRAIGKYHCAGLWSNTACSHPRVGESASDAAVRRLQYEMGIKTELREVSTLIYQAYMPESKLFEYEYDHLFVGKYNNEPLINPTEVSDYKWISIPKLLEDFQKEQQNFTPWFKLILPVVLEKRHS